MKDRLNQDEEALRLKEQLKRAVRSEAPPAHLQLRIRNVIRAQERKPSWVGRLAPVAAALAVFLGGLIAYQLGHLRLTTSSQESYIASVSSRVATLMRVGLGNHLHCSVFRKFPKESPSVAELGEKLRPEYKGLVPIVRKQIPEDYKIMLAHECRYNGRKFVHVALKSDSRLLSLVITSKGSGESFTSDELAPALAQSGISFYRAGVQRFQLASFESRDHLVYFVSDLTQQQNMQMMLAVAPQVKEFLSKLES